MDERAAVALADLPAANVECAAGFGGCAACYWIAKRVLRSDRQAVGVTAIIVLLPELMINVARVGNESLALICYSVLLVAALQVARQPYWWRWWILLGTTLGVGLLTKAYFLTAIPAVIVLAAISVWSVEVADRRVRAIAAIAARCGAALMGPGDRGTLVRPRSRRHRIMVGTRRRCRVTACFVVAEAVAFRTSIGRAAFFRW